jgi:hypothetical protein
MEKPMAPDERDRMFDKALARHLRTAAPAGEGAGISGLSSLQSGACPDPETLAAYHERALLPEQLNSLREHIVGCANCQTVLAHLEMTDEIPLRSAEQEQVLAQAAATPAAAVSSQAPALSPEARTRKSRRLLLFRRPRWQWLAPAGAIAAGLLVWIALHENSRSPLPASNERESKMAKNEAPAPISSGAIHEPQSSAPVKPAVILTRPQAPAGEPAMVEGRAASGGAKQGPVPGGTAGARSADSLTDKELRARKDRERDTSADQLTAANHADLDAKNLQEGLRKKVQVESSAPPVQTQIDQSQNSQMQTQNNNYLAQKVPGPAPLGQMQSPAKPKSTAAAAAPVPAAPPPPPGELVGGVASNYDSATSMEVARAVSNPRLISSPGSHAIWLAGRRGLIEFSKDGGSSWSRQSSGVLTELLTGSAPSEQVCWIVGRAGTIVQTVDGGAHWKVVLSPLTEDPGGIRATDALHATIWSARGTKSFETSDGGLTWKPVPNP